CGDGGLHTSQALSIGALRNIHGERGISAGIACRRVNGERLQARAPCVPTSIYALFEPFLLEKAHGYCVVAL
ncbi:MAG: hypothetical protein ACRCV9_16720, partial [Burkholderiaceae bacterium]